MQSRGIIHHYSIWLDNLTEYGFYILDALIVSRLPHALSFKQVVESRMCMKLNSSPLQITKILTSAFVVLSILNLFVQIAKYGYDYREDWMYVFNIDEEYNFPTLYSVVLLIICSVLIRQISILEKDRQSLFFKHWKILYYIFVFLAFDEAFQIHGIFMLFPELAKQLPGVFHFPWVIPYGIALAILGFYFAKLILNLPAKIKFFFLLSASLYIGGALGVEMLGGAWIRIAGNQRNLIYALLVSLEEMMEIAGLIMFIYSLMFYITKYRQEKISLAIDIS